MQYSSSNPDCACPIPPLQSSNQKPWLCVWSSLPCCLTPDSLTVPGPILPLQSSTINPNCDCPISLLLSNTWHHGCVYAHLFTAIRYLNPWLCLWPSLCHNPIPDPLTVSVPTLCCYPFPYTLMVSNCVCPTSLLLSNTQHLTMSISIPSLLSST